MTTVRQAIESSLRGWRRPLSRDALHSMLASEGVEGVPMSVNTALPDHESQQNDLNERRATWRAEHFEPVIDAMLADGTLEEATPVGDTVQQFRLVEP